MSRAPLVLLLPALFSLASGLPWPPSPPRVLVEARQWDPSPTSQLGLQGGLLRRDDGESTICGWRNADFNQPASCASGSRCVYDTLHMVVGCCPDSGPCTTGIYTSCVDKYSGSSTVSGPNILNCSAGSVCYQDSYPGGYHRYDCGTNGDAASVATTYIGQITPTTLQAVYTALSLATGTSASVNATHSVTTAPASMSSSPPSAAPGVVTVVATSTAPAVTATASAVEVVDHTTRNASGIIAGGVVGGLSFSIGVLAIGCFFLRRRQRKSKQEIGAVRVMRDLTSENASVAVVKDTNSISSYASSESDATHVHPFSPDDVGGSVDSFPQSEKLIRVPTPPLHSHPAMQAEMAGIASPMSTSSFDDIPLHDLAGLPFPWTRPPTPPPRSPKRILRQSGQSQEMDESGNGEQTRQESSVEKMAPVEEADFPPTESLAPLELYLTSPATAVPRPLSTRSSVSGISRYSRTTDGYSIGEGRRARDTWKAHELLSSRTTDGNSIAEGGRAPDTWKAHELPPSRTTDGNSIGEGRSAPDTWKAHELSPIPIIRKPVGGWYRTPSITPKKDVHKHIGYHMVDGSTLEKDIIAALPQTRQRSASGPVPMSEVQVGNTHGLNRYISEGYRRDHGDLQVRPLTLNSPIASDSTKPGPSLPVPILSVPAAPSAGEREKRLYDI